MVGVTFSLPGIACGGKQRRRWEDWRKKRGT
nr:MAG TPA: hypothetical protein [Caudoviricetes sp.]